MLPVQSEADPSPEVVELMDQPMSMFDFGLYYLETRLKEYYSEFDDSMWMNLQVNYKFKTNEIHVEIFVFPETTGVIGSAFKNKTACKVVIEERLKTILDRLNFSAWRIYFSGFLKNGYSRGGIVASEEKFRSLIKIHISGHYFEDEKAYTLELICNYDGTNKMCSE